ncbi:hypothetical protein ACO0LC_21095 [Undibacterium sp. JH2W]|uniref:hypothetical protein n=1 Tax=Undibacterium sp. JH2W TaxID=3413037 RepID=UPI003BEF8626
MNWVDDGSLLMHFFNYTFAEMTRAAVGQFHAAALAVAGKDNGKPGLRPDYGPHYYAVF